MALKIIPTQIDAISLELQMHVPRDTNPFPLEEFWPRYQLQ
jgi:hypothetical protein